MCKHAYFCKVYQILGEFLKLLSGFLSQRLFVTDSNGSPIGAAEVQHLTYLCSSVNYYKQYLKFNDFNNF